MVGTTRHKPPGKQGTAVEAAKMSGGLIASIVILCVLVVAAILLAVFLTRHVHTNKIVNYLECRNEQIHGVKVSSTGSATRNYWLGTERDGMALYTGLTFINATPEAVTTPYIITAFSRAAGTTMVGSPMIRNPLPSSSVSPPTPPPPVAYFDWALVKGVTDLASFNTTAAFAPISANAGVVAALGAVTFPVGDQSYADIVFICGQVKNSAGAPVWKPLCVLGGVVVIPDPSGLNQNTVIVGATGAVTGTLTFNVGCMPLLNMLPEEAGASDASAPPPGIAFLNAYPQIPLIGSTALLEPSYDQANFNTPAMQQNYQKTPPPDFLGQGAKCAFDPLVQSQQEGYDAGGTAGVVNPRDPEKKPTNVGPINGPKEANTVLGCHPLSVPAFDIVDPTSTPPTKKRLYSEAIIPYTQQSVDPATLPPDNVARVGTGGGMGILRLREWGTWPADSTTVKGSDLYPTAVKQSNPSITNSPFENKYATQPVALPNQYPPAATTQNAITLLYPPGKPGYTPFNADMKLPAKLCPLESSTPTGAHVADPAHVGQKPAAAPADEPILGIFYTGVAFTRGSKLTSNNYQLVMGFGMTTGTVFLRCGQTLTTLPPASELLKDGGACAYCNIPSMSARTVCWGLMVGTSDSPPGETPPGVIDTSAVPFPKSAQGTPTTAALQVFEGVGYNSPNTKINQGTGLDPPYTAVGAAVGRATGTHGQHASSVLPWIPLFNVPNGDGYDRGFGKYYGSVENSTLNVGSTTGAAVRGFCVAQGIPDIVNSSDTSKS